MALIPFARSQGLLGDTRVKELIGEAHALTCRYCTHAAHHRGNSHRIDDEPSGGDYAAVVWILRSA